MLVIRPVNIGDLDSLYDLATRAGAGLTTLPKHRQSLLEKRMSDLESSLES